MKTTTGTAKSWLTAGAAISVLLIVAAWFLLVSPVMADASQIQDETENQEARNDISRQEVSVLRDDFARMDEYEAQLATLQEQITTSQRYADLQRLVADVAETHNVTVESLQFNTATELAPAVASAPVEDELDEGTQDELTEEEIAAAAEAEAAAPPPTPSFPGLYTIGVSIELTGRYSDVLAVVNDLQVGADRILLITGMRLAADDHFANDAQGTDGALVQLDGETFVLADPDFVAERADPFAEFDPDAVREEQEALPRSEDNPLTPPTG